MPSCIVFSTTPKVNCTNLQGYQYQIGKWAPSDCTRSDVATYTVTTPTDISSCTGLLISGAEYNSLNSVNMADYSYADAAAMWGFAFSTVFMLWYLAKNLGMIISAIRRW